MAMSCNPQLLIADEPTTALDVTVQKTILELMLGLSRDTGMSTIFITHDLGVVAEIADRVIVMYKGKIVEQGSVIDIFTNPKHPYTKGLMACRPPLGKRLRKLPVINDFMDTDEKGNLIELESDMNRLIDRMLITEQETRDRMAALEKKEPILKVRDLNTWFPNKTNIFGKPLDYVKAVNDVSFDVYPGETLGLVGESGCGKTTLGRTILRLIPATSGSVAYDGKDIFNLSNKELKTLREQMQIIFQDPYSSLNPRLTVGNAIMEPMQVHKIYDNDKQRRERVIELLETVELQADHYNRYPHEFSGGQRQRICIARSLALNPKFIICDESVSALDVSVQARVLNLLINLREQFGFTYIFISHDLSVVKFMSDRMVVMNQAASRKWGRPTRSTTTLRKPTRKNSSTPFPRATYTPSGTASADAVVKPPKDGNHEKIHRPAGPGRRTFAGLVQHRPPHGRERRLFGHGPLQGGYLLHARLYDGHGLAVGRADGQRHPGRHGNGPGHPRRRPGHPGLFGHYRGENGHRGAQVLHPGLRL